MREYETYVCRLGGKFLSGGKKKIDIEKGLIPLSKIKYIIMPTYCLEKECYTRPSYGKAGGSRKDAEYCKTHAPNEYVDVVHKKCLEENCSTRPSYGKIDGTKKDAEYCSKHAPNWYVDVVSNVCLKENCTIRPSYGKTGGSRKDAEYCKTHAPNEYVDVVNKKCLEENCHILPSFGKTGSSRKDAEYCKTHAPDGYTHVVSRKCLNENCNTQPSYGKIGDSRKDVEYCSKHAPNGYMNLVSKECLKENCTIRPSYGKTGGLRKDAEYCLKHAPDEYVDVVHQKCLDKNCTIRPSYGKAGGTRKDAEYCLKHAPNGYVNVVNKECLKENCHISPSYGKIGGSSKDAEYCKTHAPNEYVDLIHKQCLEKKCGSRANYGELFKERIHCFKHKKNNEYSTNNPKCDFLDCQNKPFYTLEGNYPIRCEEHQIEGDLNIVERRCKSCELLFMLNPNELCNDCHIWNNEKITERKEIIIKKILNDKYKKYTSHDAIPNGSCLKNRPDFIWDHGTHVVILEVDENQHKSYACECEQARMVNITQDFGGLPVTWVRFNPDSYVDDTGKVYRKDITNRMPIVIDVLKKAELHIPKELCSAIYMFYDGFDKKKMDIEEIDLSSLGI